MSEFGDLVPVGVTALKDFLGTVDEDRDDAFIDEVIAFVGCRLLACSVIAFCRKLLLTWLPMQMVSTRLSSLRRSSLTTSSGRRWPRQARKVSCDWRFACTKPRTVRNHMCCGYDHFFQCGRCQVMQRRWLVWRLRNRPPMQGQITSKPVVACMLSAMCGHARWQAVEHDGQVHGKAEAFGKGELGRAVGTVVAGPVLWLRDLA